MNHFELVESRLHLIMLELRSQSHLSNYFGGETLSLDEELENIREYIEDAGEYGIAYESIVSLLENAPFVLTSKAAVSLLEVGLLLGYKSDKPCDVLYNCRSTD